MPEASLHCEELNLREKKPSRARLTSIIIVIVIIIFLNLGTLIQSKGPELYAKNMLWPQLRIGSQLRMVCRLK